MRKVTAGVASVMLACGVGASFGIAPATASPAAPPTKSPQVEPAPVEHDLPNPLESKRRDLRQAALDQVLAGQAKPVKRNGSTVVKVGQRAQGLSKARGLKPAGSTDQYVELSRQKTDRIFVVLAEFGNERHPDYPDQDTDPNWPGPATFEGPLHNAIPAPDRKVDNSTVWQADYDRKHFQDMYFGKGENTVASYYDKQSSGRYTVEGTVTDWVKVKYNEARYGRSNGFPCGGSTCSNAWELISDAVNQWVVDQKAAGRTDAEVQAELKTFDQWDRYDHDGDGDFNEPDGYIDHFQIVHAGGDQADQDPHQGEDAIWSHRWYAFYNDMGKTGPSNNQLGGTQVGQSGLWVGDYTMQPENGGIGVFAHEYGHDLGLPDLYDTAGGENPVNWWSMMAQSRLGGAGDPVGVKPGDLGAWEKLQLGWLDYEVVSPTKAKTIDLGPHEYNTDKAQAIVVPLPAKQIVTELGAPAAGTHQWYSGAGHKLNNTMTRKVTLGDGPATLSMQARWNIEDCDSDGCDYAWVEANDGTGWTAVAGSITKAAEGNAIDGVQKTYTPATFDLSAYAGKAIELRIRYQTDGAAAGHDTTLPWSGLFVDELKLTSGENTVFTDGAETADPAWTASGFARVQATKATAYPHYYLASNRSYVAYDRYLQTGPYNYGSVAKPRWAEHFALQEGLLVSYWDTSVGDNNTSVHPGSGLILPIDAHPEPLYRLDGTPWRGRIQGYDATFSRKKADSFTLHVADKPNYIRGQAAAPTFDDTKSYWNDVLPRSGVKVANAGVKITVVKQNGTSMKVRVAPTKKK